MGKNTLFAHHLCGYMTAGKCLGVPTLSRGEFGTFMSWFTSGNYGDSEVAFWERPALISPSESLTSGCFPWFFCMPVISYQPYETTTVL
jgi:hypothetical protein